MIGKVSKSAFLLLLVCLCAVSFAGCSNMPREKEIKKILSQTDPYIKAELAPAVIFLYRHFPLWFRRIKRT